MEVLFLAIILGLPASTWSFSVTHSYSAKGHNGQSLAHPSCSVGSSPHLYSSSSSSTALWRQPSKWDLILDEEDDNEAAVADDDFDTGKKQYLPCPPDMMYEPRIVQRAHRTFHAIRQAGGKETTTDVYVRDPIDREICWYTGKVARVSDVSLEECIHRLFPMIERHACHLRPVDLYPHRGMDGANGNGRLEIWTAPGDSEMEVACNRPTLQMEKFVHSKEWQYKRKDSKYPSHIKAAMVGFQGEVYQDGEDGFRTWRNDDGFPARPELNPGGDARPPTREELEQIQAELQTNSQRTSGNDDVVDAVISNKDFTKDSKTN